MSGTEAEMSVMPLCDLALANHPDSPEPAAYDGKTNLRGGQWAYMCEACFKVHGIGLGTGLGQRLIKRNEN